MLMPKSLSFQKNKKKSLKSQDKLRMTDWKISIILQLIDLDIINSTSDFANEKTEQKSNLHTEPRLNKNNGIYA